MRVLLPVPAPVSRTAPVMRRTKPLVLALALASVAAPLATAAPRQDRVIDEQIEYARGLASSWQFIDLAEEILGDLEGASLTGSQREALALARSDVYVAGARTIGDDSQREGLFDQALDGYAAFVDSYPASIYIADARRSYVGAAMDYTTHMSDLVEEAAGDEQAALRRKIEERVSSVLSSASEMVVELGDMQGRTASQENLYWTLQLDRGRLLLALGKAAKDGAGYLTLAEEEMGELAFFAPSESSFPQQAYMILGDVYLAQGRIEDAADTFAYIAEDLITQDRESWTELREYITLPQVQFRWFYLQGVTPSLIEAQMQSGNSAEGANAGLHLLNIKNLENLDTTIRGDLALVAAARALFDAGGVIGGTAGGANYRWFQTEEEAETAGFGARSIRPALELSLTLALDLAENDNGRVAARAKGLINDLIDSPGLSFGPDVLLQAAKGAYEARDFRSALTGFRRVLDEVQSDPINAQLYGAEVSYYMGECFRRQGRNIEAVMAYREGATTWVGNETYDGLNAQAAYSALSRWMKAGDSDSPVAKALQTEIARLVEDLGADSGNIYWDLAERLWKEAVEAPNETIAARKFREAAAAYAQVPNDTAQYGAARSKIGVCFYRAGDLDEAATAFDEFETELANAEGDIRKQLLAAFARVRYYQGEVAIDTSNWSRALEVFGSYVSDFPTQVEFHDVALAKAVHAAVELGQIERALDLFERLVDAYPDSPQTRNAAGRLFTPLWETYRTAEKGSAERNEVIPPLSRVVELRNKLSSSPSFDMLRIESRLWIELEQYERALETLDRINTAFADDEAYTEKLVTFVRPDLGVVYIQLDRLAEAHEILAPLVPDPLDKDAPRPSSDVVRAYIKSVAGWMKGEPTEPDVMPGVGGDEELKKALQWAVKLSGTEQTKYVPAWYEARFLELWTLYQLGKVDSQFKDSLRSILNVFKQENNNDFSVMVDNGCEPRVPALYRWLDRLAR